MSNKRDLDQLTEQLSEVSHQLSDVIERLDVFESALLGNKTLHQSTVNPCHSAEDKLCEHNGNHEHKKYHPEAGP